MSTDRRVTAEIIETLEDGANGYEHAVARLRDEVDPVVISTLAGYAKQRATFASALEGLAARYGDEIDQGGSAVASVHRGWMSLADAVTGRDASAVLAACETGDAHAISEYERALDEEISDELRIVLGAQLTDIRIAHADIATRAS